jgi:hypothetical protein
MNKQEGRKKKLALWKELKKKKPSTPLIHNTKLDANKNNEALQGFK